MIQVNQIKLPCGADNDFTKKEHPLLEKKVRKILCLSPNEKAKMSILRYSVDARKKPVLFDVFTVGVELPEGEAREKKLTARLRDRNILYKEPVQYHFPVPGTAEKCEDNRLHRVHTARGILPVPGAADKCEDNWSGLRDNFSSPDIGEGDVQTLQNRPVVIGFGPAGIYAAYLLAANGYRPLVLERGRCMEERIHDVEHFWKSGELDPASNIQFGEGGAGTFSDGKLNTNATDKAGRTNFVLRTFVENGAPEDILYAFHPHIGTDVLRDVVVNMRRKISEMGGEVRFGAQVTRILTEKMHTGAAEPMGRDDKIRGVLVHHEDGTEEEIPAQAVILAIGHSARDTVRELYRMGISMEQKNFAIGLRVSHPQRLIDACQYGISDPKELHRLHLSAANYKVTYKAASGRGVYSFCMCPGGYIVNASSEEGRTAVNGMSDYARDSARANSAIVMTVGEEDFGGSDVLAGMRMQERLEEKAYALGKGAVPVEWFQDFARGADAQSAAQQSVKSVASDASNPSMKNNLSLCIKGQYTFTHLEDLLPKDLTRDFIEGMHRFGHVIPEFDGEEALVAGVESRTSSPVRIVRDETLQSSLTGLFPAGEGAGYAGGITSAAIDGMKAAEAVARLFRPAEDD